MSDYFCPQCDASLTRQTILMLALRNMWKLWHTDHGHPGEWDVCGIRPCRQLNGVINKRETDVKFGD